MCHLQICIESHGEEEKQESLCHLKPLQHYHFSSLVPKQNDLDTVSITETRHYPGHNVQAQACKASLHLMNDAQRA